MSNDNEIRDVGNKTELIKWIEEAIAKRYFGYFEYDNFRNIQEIGSGGFGKYTEQIGTIHVLH